MTRLDLDPRNFAEVLKKAADDLRDLKTRQFAGASDIQIITNSSANSYDYADSFSGAHTIDFTADTMPNAFVDLFWQVALDSPTNIIHPDNSLYPLIDSLQAPHSITGIPTDPSVVPGVTRFVSHVRIAGGHTFYIKYFVQSTDTGTFIFT